MINDNENLETKLSEWTREDDVSNAEPSSEESKHVRWKLDVVIIPLMMVIADRPILHPTRASKSCGVLVLYEWPGVYPWRCSSVWYFNSSSICVEYVERTVLDFRSYYNCFWNNIFVC